MANSNHKKLIPNEVLLPEVARLISEGHTVTLTVRGNSMNPFLVDRRDSIVLGSFAEPTCNRVSPSWQGKAQDVSSSTASSAAAARY